VIGGEKFSPLGVRDTRTSARAQLGWVRGAGKGGVGGVGCVGKYGGFMSCFARG
jgi:hypothetical protein